MRHYYKNILITSLYITIIFKLNDVSEKYTATI